MHVPKRVGEEEKGAAHIHGIVENVEGEASDLVRHQDAEIVAQEGACAVGFGSDACICSHDRRTSDAKLQE